MMDIVENLRDMASPMAPSYAHVLERAADEIDRLRAENEAYQKSYLRLTDKVEGLKSRIAELEAELDTLYREKAFKSSLRSAFDDER